MKRSVLMRSRPYQDFFAWQTGCDYRECPFIKSFVDPAGQALPAQVMAELPDTRQLVNFQLTASANVRGAVKKVPLPAFSPEVTVGGYRVRIEKTPRVTALRPAFVTIRIRDSKGRSPRLEPWFGALAHAIFFREGSLAYFHTHICAPNAPNCGSLPGVPASRITGSSSAPGKLTVGVLLAVPGTWRLFLQMKLDGRIITAPYTLNIAS